MNARFYAAIVVLVIVTGILAKFGAFGCGKAVSAISVLFWIALFLAARIYDKRGKAKKS